MFFSFFVGGIFRRPAARFFGGASDELHANLSEARRWFFSPFQQQEEEERCLSLQ